MLYIYSWRSSWAGKIVLEETVRKDEKVLREKIRILEEMAAPDHDIVEARIGLAKVLFLSGDYNGARYTVDDADSCLARSQDTSDKDTSNKDTSNKNIGDRPNDLVERVMLNKLAALSFRESGLYQFAQDRYDKIAKLLDQANGAEPVQNKNQVENTIQVQNKSQVQYMKLVLLNEQAVLHYVWANSSKAEAERKQHYALAESLFQKCSKQSRMHLNDSDGAKYKRLEELTQANLSELVKDLSDRHGV